MRLNEKDDARYVSMTKSLYEAVNNVGFVEQFLKIAEMHNQMPKQIKEDVETKLPKEALDALEWAKEFMERYENKRKNTKN